MTTKDQNPNVNGRISMDAAYLHNELEWERQDKAKWIEKYHQADKKQAILESQKHISTVWGVIFNCLLTIAGSLFMLNFGINLITALGVILFFIAFFGSIHNLKK